MRACYGMYVSRLQHSSRSSSSAAAAGVAGFSRAIAYRTRCVQSSSRPCALPARAQEGAAGGGAMLGQCQLRKTV